MKNFDTEKKDSFSFLGYSSILIEELPVFVPAEECGSHLRHLLFGDHGQPRLQRVAHLDLRALSVKLNTSGAGKQNYYFQKHKKHI